MGYNCGNIGFGENLSDNEIVNIIYENNDEPTVLEAIGELSRREISNRLDIYRDILNDENSGKRSKIIVAGHLGFESTDANQELLLKVLEDGNDFLFRSAVNSLGKIGNEKALKQLEKIVLPSNSSNKQILEFSKSLLAYRLRINKHLIEIPSEMSIANISNRGTIKFKKAEKDEVKEAINDVKKEIPAVGLQLDGATKLICDSTEFLLIFTNDFHKSQEMESLKDYQALPIIILEKNDYPENYFLSTYLFTHPSGDGANTTLIGVNIRGYVTYVGTFLNQFENIQMNSLKSRYVSAINVAGYYDFNQQFFKFSKALSGSLLASGPVSSNTPEKIQYLGQ